MDTSGLPAVPILMLLIYVLVYLPLKLVAKVIAHAKEKAARVRLLKQGTIVAEYEPPAGLTPAEIGYLFDGKLMRADVLGTIASLDQQDVLSIDRSTGQLVLTSVGAGVQLLGTYEQSVVSYLGQYVGQRLTHLMLKKLASIGTPIIKTKLREQGYIVSVLEQLKRSAIRIGSTTAVLMILFPFLAFRPTSFDGILLSVFVVVFFSPAYIILAVALFRAYQSVTGERWLGTPKLKQIWPDIEGYREYISMVELQQLKFESNSQQETVKNKNLPYAIALGLNTDWQKKL